MNNSNFTGLMEDIMDKHNDSGCSQCKGGHLCVARVLDKVSTLYKYGGTGILNLEPCLRGMLNNCDKLNIT